MNKIKYYFKKIIFEIKDYLFPIFCLDCEKEGEWVCSRCLEQINCSGFFCCPVCHQKNDGGTNCLACNSSLNFAVAITKYDEDKLIGKIIQALKYQYVEEMGESIKALIKKFIKANKDVFSKIDLVVPVPLYKKRLAERGFNQAEIIAKIVAEELKLNLLPALKRKVETKQQAKLNREERIKNVFSAFILADGVSVNNKNILLIDDVFTTGSTMQECARVLKQSGAGLVGSFTVARG